MTTTLDCPKCKGEDSLYVSTVLKWNHAQKWQFIKMCKACKYEERLNK